MQIIPAFAYLMPIVILFSVGPGAAVITTMIYAIPPAIRITALGIRGVPSNTVEAAESMGSTSRGSSSSRCISRSRGGCCCSSVNQTILFALSMVVIAGLIGGKGLGDVVTSGLNSYPALALLAGIVIVVMAMALDRVTEAVAERTNPANRHLTDGAPAQAAWGIDRDQRKAVIVATIAAARILGGGLRLLAHDGARLAAQPAAVGALIPSRTPTRGCSAFTASSIGDQHRPVRTRPVPQLPRRDALGR